MRQGILEQKVQNDDGTVTNQKLLVGLQPKDISRGWNMTYKDPLYDFIETLTPAKFKLYRLLERMILSSKGKDIQIIGSRISNDDTVKILESEDTSYESTVIVESPTNDPKAVSKMLTHMVKHNIIMETKAKHYRFNPFIVLPSFAKGELLQAEWGILRQKKEYKRRGRDILDEYYDFKKRTRQPKLTFEDWQKYNEENDIDICIEPSIIAGEGKKKIVKKTKQEQDLEEILS